MRVKGSQDTGALLSNTRIIYPQVGDNLGKLRLIPHSCYMLECFGDQRILPEDESVVYQVVCGVMDHIA